MSMDWLLTGMGCLEICRDAYVLELERAWVSVVFIASVLKFYHAISMSVLSQLVGYVRKMKCCFVQSWSLII